MVVLLLYRAKAKTAKAHISAQSKENFHPTFTISSISTLPSF
jgi:hypothetical protein